MMSMYSRVRASGLAEGLAVPALDDLRTGHTEAEDVSTAGEVVQGQGAPWP